MFLDASYSREKGSRESRPRPYVKKENDFDLEGVELNISSPNELQCRGRSTDAAANMIVCPEP